MYNYHSDIIWTVNAILLGVIIVTSIVIFTCIVFKNFLWHRRKRALHNIKNGVSKIVLAHMASSQTVCEPFTNNLTPQQFIDIETNRNIDMAFFNDSEQQFLRGCSISPEMLSRIKKIATASRNKWKKIEALLVLGYTQDKLSMEILQKSLLNKDNDIVYFSMISLGQIRTAQSAKILLEFLRKDPSNGYKIASILESFPKEISDEVVKLTEYYDPLVKYWAIAILSKLASSACIKQVERLSQDGTAEIRAAACDCLGSIGSKDAAPKLLKCMKDDNWLVKSRAILAFGKVMGDAALPEVTKLINDASWSVLDAVKEVMTAHIEASLPYIERFLAGSDEIAKKYSVMALENSGYIIKLLNIIVSEGNKDLALRLLKGVLNSRAHFGLDAAINHLSPAMRIKALGILENIEKE